ncbi:MAG: CPBP family intramembrane metalloprotease [Planctomycetes bacterium]|nr:CPBP family intramembrane metalloprotease [Planctomycetota bacterium]
MTAMQRLLLTIDIVVSGMAVVLLTLGILWWVVRSRRDPLGDVPARPNRIQEDSILLAALGYMTAMFVLGGFIRVLGLEEGEPLAALIVGSGAQLVGIAICLLIAAARFEGGVHRFLIGITTLSSPLMLTLGLTLFAIGFCPILLEATIGVVRVFAPGYEFKAHATIDALHDTGQPMGLVIALWVGAAAVAPVGEELFFRGLLQTFLVGMMRNRWLAIATAAAAFGAVHYPYPHTIPTLVVLGVVMGYAYERTGSLLPAIAIHAAFNLKALVWDMLGGFAQ